MLSYLILTKSKCFHAAEIRKPLFLDKPQLKFIIFKNYNHEYLIHTRSDNKGTLVNRASSSGGSIEITRTVPLEK